MSAKNNISNEAFDKTGVKTDVRDDENNNPVEHTTRESKNSPEKFLKWPVVKSKRFLSEWNDPIVRMEYTQKNADKQDYHEIALDDIILNLEGAEGIYTGMHKLGDFPHLVRSLKVAINSALLRSDSGSPRTAITDLMTHGISLIIVMLRKGKYYLAQVERQDVQELLHQLAAGGWTKPLKQNKVLGKLLSQASRDPELLWKLISRSKNKYITINIEFLAKKIGMPISSMKVPFWFSEKLAELSGRNHIRTLKNNKVRNKNNLNRSCFSTALNVFNILGNQREDGDFLPFQTTNNISGLANTTFSNSSRSKNLSLNDAVQILTACTDWVLDLAPDIIEIAAFARDTSIKISKTDSRPQDEERYQSQLAELLNQFRTKYHKVIAKFWPSSGKPSDILQNFIDYIQFSATNLISALYALRANDAIGHKKDYGLYHGCVRAASPGSSTKVIEIFLSKSPREYRSFWATDMTVKIISVLERLREATRPSDSSSYVEHEAVEDRRLQKLYGRTRITPSGINRFVKFVYQKVKQRFLGAIGLHASILDGQRAFRRLHCILYVYRYTDARIEALSRRLGHASIHQTHWYVTDASMTAYRKSVERNFKLHEATIAQQLKEVQSELFQQQLENIMSGRDIGGGFSSFVGRVVTKMSRSIEFSQKPISEKVKIVQKELTDAGYRPDSRRHGSCMLGEARTAKYGANCREDGNPRPENASLTKCQGCRNGLNAELNLSLYERDLNDLEQKAEDFELPARLRLAAKSEAEHLSKIIAAERNLTAQNRAYFEKLQSNWKHAARVAEKKTETYNG